MNLRVKALLTLLPLAVVCGSTAVALSRRAVFSTLVEEAARSGIAVMEEMQPSFQDGAAARSEKELLPRLQALIRRVDAAYALITDAEGNIIAHTNVAITGKIATEPVIKASETSGEASYSLYKDRPEPLLDLAVPVWAVEAEDLSGEAFMLSGPSASPRKRNGSLVMRMPISKYLQFDRMISGRLLWVIVSVMSVTFMALFILLELAMRPVKLLASATERVRGGEYGVTVATHSSDEIGRLTDSFNRMSLGLRDTTVSRDYLDDLLRNMLDAVMVTDKNAVITMINPAGVRLTGRDASELIGRRASDVFTRECREKNDWIGRAMRGEIVEGREAALETREGKEVPVLLSVARLAGSKEGGGLVAVVRNISERKKMEASLLQSEKMSAVGVLAAGVAHEINNPLGIILGFAQAMSKKIQDADVLALPVRSIEREAVRCKNLVQSLLAFSRSSKSEQWEELDVNSALDGAMALVLAQAKIRSVEVKVELTPGLPKIFANRNQVQQVAINLASNAIDAMAGGGVLFIRTAPAPGRDGGVLLRVADTGCGIPEEIRGKVFEPFFSTKEVGKGTGLGLALVYEIVQKHKGEIGFESERDKGTVFSVLFPRGRGPAEG